MALTPDKLASIMGLRPTGDLGPLTWYTKTSGTIVYFPRSPPKCPPTDRQIYQRNQLRRAAIAWQLLDAATRANWEQATKRLSLRLTGYNLWTYYHITGDTSIIDTVSRHSGLDLHYALQAS